MFARTLFFCAAIAAGGTSIAAEGEKKIDTAYPGHPCAAEIKRFCPDAGAGTPPAQCLKQHRKELSEPCRANMAAQREQAQNVRTACADDRKRFCGDVARDDRAAMMRCMREHREQLSEACRAATGGGEKGSGRKPRGEGAES